MQASAATPAGCFLRRPFTGGRRGVHHASATPTSGRRTTTTTTTTRRRRRRSVTVVRCSGEPGATNRSSNNNNNRNLSPSIQNRGSAARLEVMRPKPLFSIGLFADAQYADKDDHERPTEKGRIKYFRASPDRLREALADFKSQGEGMACIINLGDLIDGYNDDDVTVEVPTRKGPVPEELAQKSRNDMNMMAAIVRRGRGSIPVYHCLGNHDLNLPREEVTKILGNPGNAAYFVKRLPRRWRLVVLDTTEVNPRYLEPGSEAQAAGEKFVREAKAKAKAKNAGAGDGVGEEGGGEVKPWGGGLGPEQMSWLLSQLRDAEEAGDRVIVASHISLSTTGARPGMAAWNAADIAPILEASPAVAVCVAGHDHPGGYGRTLVKDREGLYNTFGRVHYVTLEAMLEAPEGSTSYAVLEVYDHEVAVKGVGSATSRRLQVSPDGVFTGIATFGRAVDVMEDGLEGGGGEGSSGAGRGAGLGGDSSSDMGLLDWINANRGNINIGDGGGDIELK